ncbi:organomercurial lyase [Nocardia sp. NPDC055049]
MPELAEVLAGHDISLAAAMRRLHESDVVRLDGDGEVAPAYPFLGTPTRHRVQILGGPAVYAMRAVDAIRLTVLDTDTDTDVYSADPVTDAPITVAIDHQHLTVDPRCRVRRRTRHPRRQRQIPAATT